jgi:hypothetical protein
MTHLVGSGTSEEYRQREGETNNKKQKQNAGVSPLRRSR